MLGSVDGIDTSFSDLEISQHLFYSVLFLTCSLFACYQKGKERIIPKILPVIFIQGILLLIAMSIHSMGYKRNAKGFTSEAKLRLAEIYTTQTDFCTDRCNTDLHSLENNEKGQVFKVGDIVAFPEYAQYCPDCIVTKEKFKYMAVYKYEDPKQLAVLTIDHDKVLHIVEDNVTLSFWEWYMVNEIHKFGSCKK